MKHVIPFLLVLLLACGKVEFSPNQKFDADTPVDLNNKELAKLQSRAHDDTIRFALTGDTQRAYSDCEDMVQKLNTLRGVDFVLLNGDISDFGLYQEMEWVNEIYSEIDIPYISIMGNHDTAANGRATFMRMFGEPNFSFVYDGIKFLCHDTNSREYNFNGTVPNIDWLSQQMEDQQGIAGYVAVSHVPSFDNDFDRKLEQDYVNTLLGSGKLLASLHAHINSTKVTFPYDDKTPFIVTNTVAKRQFFLIDIVNGKLSYQIIDF